MDEHEVKKPEKWFGIRHIHYLFFFTASFVSYLNRNSFNTAILAMIDEQSVRDDIPTYPDWSPHKNVMLSSYFWGYIATQIIAAQLAERFGPKWVLTGTFFTAHLFVLFVPLFGNAFGYQGVIACRVITGLSFGFMAPCLYNLLAHWSNIADRAKACGFMYAGVPLGILSAMLTSGLICGDSNFGWPAVYYIYGTFGMVWTVLWIIFGAHSPSSHRTISTEEKEYISRGLEIVKETEVDIKKLPTPWISIMTSLPHWAILINDCGFSWGSMTLLTEIPSFMQYIMNFDIASNSLVSALPYLAYWLLSMVVGNIADYIIKRKYTSLIWSRRIFNSIAMFVPAVALICLTFVGSTERVGTVALLVVAVGCSGGVFSGFTVNRIDLSPNYAATLLGISNTMSNSFSLLGPLSLDIISNSTGYVETDKELWTIVFYTAAVIYILIGTLFILASSGDVQPWNDPYYKKEKRALEKDHNES